MGEDSRLTVQRGDKAATSSPAMPRTDRFERLVERARLALVWERLWPALWPLVGVAIVFATVSWLGLWLALPPLGRAIGTGLAALMALAAVVHIVRVALPDRRDALGRLDRDSALSHRPASTIDDALALGKDDPATLALWQAHRRKAQARIETLKVSAPRPGMSGRDRFALRGTAIVALAASAFVAGPELGSRLVSAFDWSDAIPSGPQFRIDGWVDPPLYTRLPPVILDLHSSAAEPTRIKVPFNSTLVIRAAGKAAMDLKAGPAIEAKAAPAPARGDLIEQRFTITGNGTLEIRADGARAANIVIEAIADHAPEIRFAGDPQVNARGSLTIAYVASDDYGLTSAEGIVEREDTGSARRSLVPAPTILLSLPVDPTGKEETKTTADLSAHPWAGARVNLTLVVKDEAGQEGRSETRAVTLPQRPFTKPLAKALVEERRRLIVEPDKRRRVQTALDSLLIAPEQFTPDPAVYLGLRLAAQRLRRAISDADLLETADWLWQMALQIEEGDLSEVERDLRAAQDALRQALERGASEEEIRKLTQDLRAALDKFLSELAQRLGRENQNNAQNQRQDQNTRTITPNDLKNLLDRMEDLARQGATADAQRLLEELRNILENLQTARPGGRQSDPMAREFNRALEELDQMIRDQQALRDDTFRDGQNRQQQQRRAGRNQQRQGQQGQPSQRGGQRQQGENGEEQAEGGEEGQDGQQGQGLSQRQQTLRERLQELQQRMKGFGLQGEQGLGEAEGSMRDAEGSLGQGQSGQAVDSQGRALDALRKGAQGLAQQMMGDGEGSEQAGNPDGSPGRSANRGPGGQRDTDPLGRPTRGRDWTDGQVRIPTGDESTVARARRILEELRRRLGEPDRTRDELDYIERLLRRN